VPGLAEVARWFVPARVRVTRKCGTRDQYRRRGATGVEAACDLSVTGNRPRRTRLATEVEAAGSSPFRANDPIVVASTVRYSCLCLPLLLTRPQSPARSGELPVANPSAVCGSCQRRLTRPQSISREGALVGEVQVARRVPRNRIRRPPLEVIV
jgi:hypothetical protein